jgi:hypothetical protein
LAVEPLLLFSFLFLGQGLSVSDEVAEYLFLSWLSIEEQAGVSFIGLSETSSPGGMLWLFDPLM